MHKYINFKPKVTEKVMRTHHLRGKNEFPKNYNDCYIRTMEIGYG